MERFFDGILLKPFGKRLLDWQRKPLRDVYGNVDMATGLRNFREVYISVPKKNGKSFLIAGIPLYHMLIEAEQNRKAFGAAATRAQAGIVFEHAANMVSANPYLRDRIKVTPSTKTMSMRDGSATYRVLAALDGGNDGFEPSLNLFDELHEWVNVGCLKTYKNMTKGTRSRQEPLDWKITTAGEVGRSSLCQQQDELAQSVLNGAVKSQRFYASRWCADPVKLRDDPEYWKSREARVEANPSHEDNGGFLRDKELQADLENAINIPAQQPDYLRYTLNVWVSSLTRYLPADKWHACAGDQRSMIGRHCIAGLDLSEKTDLTALVLLFPDSDGTFDVLPFFWMPGAIVAERERKDKAPYAKWIRQGLIEVCEGSVVSHAAVRAKIDWAKSMFDLRQISYDSWHASQFVEAENGLIDAGYTCIKAPQSYATLSEPTKRLLEVTMSGQLRHGGNEVLTWMADCASSRVDGKDNVMLVKPNRLAESKRIDGIAALVNAFYVYVRDEVQTGLVAFV